MRKILLRSEKSYHEIKRTEIALFLCKKGFQKISAPLLRLSVEASQRKSNQK